MSLDHQPRMKARVRGVEPPCIHYPFKTLEASGDTPAFGDKSGSEVFSRLKVCCCYQLSYVFATYNPKVSIVGVEPTWELPRYVLSVVRLPDSAIPRYYIKIERSYIKLATAIASKNKPVINKM